jgi:Periplasmic binding protein
MSLRLRWPSIRPTSLATSNSGPAPRRGGRGQNGARLALELAALWLVSLTVGSCQFLGSAPKVVKIGVIAPFEGVGRQLGYAVLPGVKSELASVNGERLLGDYRVSLVALNDDLDPGEAAAQAKALAKDPDVVAVIGLWSDGTAASAAPILAEAGVPTLFAVPRDGPGPTTQSLCPRPRQVATELLRGAQGLDGFQIVVTGPDTALRKALVESEPGLAVVAEAAPDPCQEETESDCAVIYAGDATGAAEALRRWRALGWDGPFLGGPEIARPWFVERAGGESEGTRAVICGGSDLPLTAQDMSLQYSAELAGAATRSILTGLRRAIVDAGKPTRQTLASALSSSAAGQDMAWIEVRSGRWVPLHE